MPSEVFLSADFTGCKVTCPFILARREEAAWLEATGHLYPSRAHDTAQTLYRQQLFPRGHAFYVPTWLKMQFSALKESLKRAAQLRKRLYKERKDGMIQGDGGEEGGTR